MKKQFHNFDNAFIWVNEKVKKGVEKSIPEIAENAYQDSKKYTFFETGDMFYSGDVSSFENSYLRKKGYVVIRGPQVKKLYYVKGLKAGPGNPGAVPQWFEATKLENMTAYKRTLATNIEKG
jgi:hypothetical protein